jgi:hypothetical protein
MIDKASVLIGREVRKPFDPDRSNFAIGTLVLRRSDFDGLVHPTDGWPSQRDERSFKES